MRVWVPALALLLGGAAHAEVTTPRPGDPERKAVIGEVRVPMELTTRGPVIFDVGTLNVERPWAFFQGEAMRPGGKPIDHEGTAFEKDGGSMDGWWVHAILYHSEGRWHLLDHHVAPTDLSYGYWPAHFGAPCRVVFPDNVEVCEREMKR